MDAAYPAFSFNTTSNVHRGLKKHGGKIRLAAHVEEILVEEGRASGVRLRGGEILHASQAVVSNASLNDTLRMLPAGHPATDQLEQQAQVSTKKEKNIRTDPWRRFQMMFLQSKALRPLLNPKPTGQKVLRSFLDCSQTAGSHCIWS